MSLSYYAKAAGRAAVNAFLEGLKYKTTEEIGKVIDPYIECMDTILYYMDGLGSHGKISPAFKKFDNYTYMSMILACLLRMDDETYEELVMKLDVPQETHRTLLEIMERWEFIVTLIDLISDRIELLGAIGFSSNSFLTYSNNILEALNDTSGMFGERNAKKKVMGYFSGLDFILAGVRDFLVGIKNSPEKILG